MRRLTRPHLVVRSVLDADGDGFLGAADLKHWHRTNVPLMEVPCGGREVRLEDLRQQLADALHQPQLPPAFSEQVPPCSLAPLLDRRLP